MRNFHEGPEGQFAHTVTHDLKAPLSTIIALERLIEGDDKNDLSEESTEYLQLIQLKAFDMDSMIHEILEQSLSENTMRSSERIDLNLLVESVLQTLSVERNLKVHISKNLPTVYGREVQLTRVFENIVSNAIKYNDKKRTMLVFNSEETSQGWNQDFA